MATMIDVPSVFSERLELRSLSPAFLAAALAGRLDEAERLLGVRIPTGWAAETAGLLRMRLEQLQAQPEELPWLLRAVLRRGPEPVMVGHFNFHGPPIDGAAEVGYTIRPEHRRLGYAAEAAAAMIAWARTEHGVQRFLASVSPNNEPSLRLVRRLGFVEIGEQLDEVDGIELVFELVPANRSTSAGPTLRP